MHELDQEKIYLKIFSATSRTLSEITEGIEHLTPQQTDLYRTQLTALYGLLSDEMARLEQQKAMEWLKIKAFDPETGERLLKPLSDKMTDTTYDTTEVGQRRIELKFRLKAMEKMMSALAGRMHRLNQEFYNQ